MKRPVILLAGLFLLPALAICQQDEKNNKEVHKEVRVIVHSDDASVKTDGKQVKVMVLRDTLITITAGQNERPDQNVNVNIQDENGTMVIRMDENGKESQIIRLDMRKLDQEMDQLTKELGTLSQKDIERLLEQHVPILQNAERMTIALDTELEGLEIELKELEKHLEQMERGDILIENVHITGDTVINEVKVSDDGRFITKTIVIRANVNVEELTDGELNRIREKNKDKSQATLQVDKLEFYPNPSDGRFTVNFISPVKGDLEITVTDMNGKQVYSESVPGFQGTYNKQYDLSAVSKGMYILRMTIGQQSHYKKLMID